MNMRAVRIWVCALAGAMSFGGAAWGGTELGGGGALVVTFQNSVQLPANAVDQNAVAFTVTGMSGVVRMADGGFAAVMDNSNKVVRFSLAVNSGTGAVSSPVLAAGVSLESTRDFEGIARMPPASSGFGMGDVLLSDEAAPPGGPGVSRWAVPSGIGFGNVGVPSVFGAIRANFGFESLTSGVGRLAHDEVWAANEEALTVDGAASSQSAGTTVRLLRMVGGVASQQFAYVCDPWHGTAISGARSGLSDLCLLPDGRLLALERSFAFSGSGFFRTRIYLVDVSGATDVSGLASLGGGGFTAATKTLLYSGFLQNVEGLCVGPALTTSGEYALIGITDDADPISTNSVYAWKVAGVGPVPCAGDVNDDGFRNTADLTGFLGAFGSAGAPGFRAADLVPDGTVNTADLVFFLGRFGQGCP
ncbi:MAG: esterase-like activity of phytase family protein [Phycisphaerales bacterium]